MTIEEKPKPKEDTFKILYEEDLDYYDGPLLTLRIGKYPKEEFSEFKCRAEIVYDCRLKDDDEGFSSSMRWTREDLLKVLEMLDKVEKENQ